MDFFVTALTGPAAPTVASLSSYVGVLPATVLLSLLGVLFCRAVGSSVDQGRYRALARHMDVAIVSLTLASVVIVVSFVSSIAG